MREIFKKEGEVVNFKCSIQAKKDTEPIFMKSRLVPIAFQALLKKKLNKLVKEKLFQY